MSNLLKVESAKILIKDAINFNSSIPDGIEYQKLINTLSNVAVKEHIQQALEEMEQSGQIKIFGDVILNNNNYGG